MSARQTEIKSSGGGSAIATTAAAVIADNVIVRGDGGARGIQGSGITISDLDAVAGALSISTPTLLSPVGSALSESATAPAAKTGSSQVGVAVNIDASDAVASTDTNGAAAGGAVNVGAGDAARRVSGDANGGAVVLTPGAGIGTGVAGNVVVNAGQLTLSTDVGIARLAAGVLKSTNGSTGSGWIQQAAARSRVAGAASNGGTILAEITGLSATVIAGRKYTGELVLFCNNSTPADGFTVAFNGGTATITSFIAQGTLADDTSCRVTTRSTSLAGGVQDVSGIITGSALFCVKFGFVVDQAGTFIPQFAMQAATFGTATIAVDSYMWLEDTP